MVVGMAASLLKGFDYEEAGLLLLVLLILWRARPAFDRRAAFFDTRFSAGWIAAVAGALGASIWLGFFAFKHVDYSRQLWWQFELQGDASRFLRASVGAAIVLLLFGFARLIRPRAARSAGTDRCAISRMPRRRSRRRRSTFPYLVYLRDKALLFNDERTAFIMYGVQGRTWVALGDPVGPEDQFGRAAAPFPRTLRRLRRRAGVLRDRQDASAPLRRLRADVRQARRGSDGRPDALHARRRPRRRNTVRRCGASKRTAARSASSTPADVPAILDQLRSGLRRLARGESRRRKRASRSGSSTRRICRGFRSR